MSFYFPQKQKILRLSAGGRKQSDKYPNHGNERQLREIQTQLQIHTDAKTHTKQCFSIFPFQISTVFKFDKFQYRFGMSRQLWKADFQIRVWQKIQTLNPANPGMALQQGRSLGKLFFFFALLSELIILSACDTRQHSQFLFSLSVGGKITFLRKLI